MRKIILNLAVSLDGYIEGPQGQVDWCILDNEVMDDLCLLFSGVDAILYGRKSYELYGNYIPSEESDLAEKQLYEITSKMKKYVISTSMVAATPPDTVIKGDDVEQQILDFKRQEGKDIWLFGGAGLISSMVRFNLIDEYQIAVHPVVLGGGLPLFGEISTKINLRLQRVKTYHSGLVGLYYHPVM